MSKKKYSEDSDCLILGNPGTGKTLTAKRDILDAFNNTKDEIFICDPEGEFYPFVNELGGQVIKISPTSPCHVNPMDISLIYPDYSYPDNSADDDPMTLKANFFLSLCELAVGGRNGLTFEERSLINFCVRNVYVDHFKNPVPENMPILEDLYNLLRGYAEKDEAAQRIAASLELYVTGSQNLFNHRTNVVISNRLVCFDISEIEKHLRKFGMLIIQDQVWKRVSDNRKHEHSIRYYADEIHLLLKDKQTASYFVDTWKRFRKLGCIFTGITQNVDAVLPFINDFPENTKLCKVVTTKLEKQV